MSLYSAGLAGAAGGGAPAPQGGISSLLTTFEGVPTGSNGTYGTPKPPSKTPPSSSTSNNAPTKEPPLAQYDLSADPVLQQVQAQITAANSQDKSAALTQEEQALLQYGDANLASSILGSGDPIVAAIRAGDPESQLAQLGRQNTQQTRQFEETIDPSLVDSGYRVEQEGNLAQAYQDALAQAAAGIQSQIQGIQGNLSSEEAANNDTLSQAISAAYDRALAAAMGGGSASSGDQSYLSILQALGG